MELKLILIVKCLKDLGLKVNEAKTEACLFYRKDTPQVEILVALKHLKKVTQPCDILVK